MDKHIRQLADQAGTMTGGLAIILDKLAAIEHQLTDTRADLLDPESIESAAVLSATDELARLADYVADLKSRTAPASPPTPDGETSTPPPHPGPLSYGAATAAVGAALAHQPPARSAELPADLQAKVAAGTMPEYLAWMAAAVRNLDIPTDADLGYQPGQAVSH
jgi:hypothetical protein